MRRRAVDLALLAAIVAFGAFLRFDRLGVPSLWLDEILDYDNATKFAAGPWWRWLTGFASEHGPLFFASELAGRVARAPEISARLMPALFGIAAIVVIWFCGRRFGVGLVAALLLAASPFHVYYSREARPYALLMLIAAGLLLSRRFVPSILLLGAALFTTAGAAPLLFAAGIAAFIAGRRRIAIASFAAAILVPLLYRQQPGGADNVPFALPAHLGREQWIFLALAVIGAVVLVRRDRTSGFVVIALAVLPALFTLGALALLHHWYAQRYFAAALPAYVLLAAAGIVAIVRIEYVGVAAATLIAFQSWPALREEPFRKLPWREIAASIAAHAHVGDIVLATNEWSATCLRFYLPPGPRLLSAGESVERARRVVASHTPVWIVSAGYHRNGTIVNWACRYPVVLAATLESFHLHYAPDLRHLVANRLTDADRRTLAARFPAQTLTLGSDDDVFLGDGWYGPESMGGNPARWSSQISTVMLLASRADHRLSFRALPIETPQRAAVVLNGVDAGFVDLVSEWHDYVVAIPRERWSEGPNTLTFRFTNVKIPSARDTRRLSAMFDAISLDAGPPTPPEVMRHFRIDAPLLDRPLREPSRFRGWNDARLSALLGRLGFDPQATMPRLRRGEVTIEQLADTFAVSSECLSDEDFLRLAWPVLVGRPADPYGLRDFLGALKRGTTRSHVVRGLVKSPEFRERIN